MNHRNILTLAILIFSLGYFVRSFQPVYAIPQGPNISTGSNPVDNFYGNSNTTGQGSITFQGDFTLTTLISNTSNCDPKLDGATFHTGTGSENMFYYRFAYYHPSPFTAGTAKLSVSSGSTLTLSGCGRYYIEGYYTH
tara:strand:- start:22 stop:435 length:414 start_codon:yes stop_codon:yes gene_type:complete